MNDNNLNTLIGNIRIQRISNMTTRTVKKTMTNNTTSLYNPIYNRHYIPNGPSIYIQQPSMRHHRYITEAVYEAEKSSVYHKHGCVIVCNGRVLARGYNHLRCTSSDGLIKNCCTCHAEIAALRNLGNTYCKARGDHRYWVQRGKVSTARKKSNYLHSSCGG